MRFIIRKYCFSRVGTDMKTYEIHKVSGIVEWDAVPVIKIDHAYMQTPDTIKAYAQICYNEEELLVHLRTVEKNIRAVENGPLGRPWEDSCLEFFFCPEENDNRYFNIEFNSNGCLFLGFGTGLSDRVRLIKADINEVLCPKINLTDDGWEIFYRIPYSFIKGFFPDFKVYEGKIIKANCYKCADFSEPPHYLSWSTVSENPFTFHNFSCFGTMKFVE